MKPHLLRADATLFSLPTIAQSTLQTRSACGCMPACVWEQHAVEQAGWMVMQMAATSRGEMHGQCVKADKSVLCLYTSK